MSFESLLMHRATIQRRTAGDNVDEHGGDTDAFAEIATDVRCRMYSTRGTEVLDASGTRRLVTTLVDFPLGTDITPADRIVIDGRTWELISVDVIADHHLQAGAERRDA